MPPQLKLRAQAGSTGNTLPLPWIAASPTSALTAPLNSVFMALPPKVQRSGPRRGTSAWKRWLRAGAFVHNFANWHWFCTLTFKFDDVTEARARGMVREWLDGLARQVGSHVRAAIAIEGHVSGALHIHLLVGFPDGLPIPTLYLGDDLWTWGFTRLRIFDANGGGAWYLVKTGHWGIMYGCPRRHICRRHNRCVHAKDELDTRQ